MSFRIRLMIRCRTSCRIRWSRLSPRWCLRPSRCLRMKTRLLCWPGHRRWILHGRRCLQPPQTM